MLTDGKYVVFIGLLKLDGPADGMIDGRLCHRRLSEIQELISGQNKPSGTGQKIN
jgi:hypothetical protein